MVQTKKFSEFPGPVDIIDGDIIVGLRDGKNYQFNASSGSGSGGAVTTVIEQVDHGFDKGDWVRIDPATGDFVLASSVDSENAEIQGLVIKGQENDPNEFTLQVVGFVSDENGPVFDFDLVPGNVYFLSDSAPGEMSLNEPVTTGEISLPLFIAYTTTTGFIRQSRGIIIGGEPPIGDGSDTSPSIHNFTQASPSLTKGQVVRRDTSGVYLPADATSFVNAQAVGIITAVAGNNYTLQTEGFTTDTLTQDENGANLQTGKVYYLSTNTTTGGLVTLTPPSSVGQAVRPIFICETGGATPTGFILPQFPSAVTASQTNTNIINFTQTSPVLSVGKFVYLANVASPGVMGAYTFAQGNSLTSSQVVGLIIAAAGNNYTLQTEGYIQNIITTDDKGNALQNGVTYYLSTTQPGLVTPTEPLATNLISKPVFTCEKADNIGNVYTGYILPQRPLPNSDEIVTNPLITTINQPNHDLEQGMFVYLNDTKDYVPAIATSKASAAVVGMVKEVIGTGNDTFVLQSGGYNTDAVALDDEDQELVPGELYYLSATDPGKIHNAPPATNNYATLCYIPEQIVTGGSGINAGYILPQQPQLVGGGGGGGGLLNMVAYVNWQAIGGTANPYPPSRIRASGNIASIVVTRFSNNFQAGYFNFSNELANSNYIFLLSGGNFGASSTPGDATCAGGIGGSNAQPAPSTTQCPYIMYNPTPGSVGGARYNYAMMAWFL